MILTNVTKAPSTRIRFRLKTQLLLCGYGFRPQVSDENDYRKPNSLETFSRVEFFEKAVFVFTCGRGNTLLFENDDVSVLDLPYPRERKWRDMVILSFCFA